MTPRHRNHPSCVVRAVANLRSRPAIGLPAFVRRGRPLWTSPSRPNSTRRAGRCTCGPPSPHPLVARRCSQAPLPLPAAAAAPEQERLGGRVAGAGLGHWRPGGLHADPALQGGWHLQATSYPLSDGRLGSGPCARRRACSDIHAYSCAILGAYAQQWCGLVGPQKQRASRQLAVSSARGGGACTAVRPLVWRWAAAAIPAQRHLGGQAASCSLPAVPPEGAPNLAAHNSSTNHLTQRPPACEGGTRPRP